MYEQVLLLLLVMQSPSFLFDIFKMVIFPGGSFFNWFPLSHLTSDNFDQLFFGSKNIKLSLSFGSSVNGNDRFCFCYNDLANKELFSGRNSSTVCYYSMR
ncbi:inner membrane ABC transporter permease yejB [Bartonella quintana JK 12]|uniref:Inner membrane ABC transporter permease yejB n=2 Tax=Bartonella quintana TaxID=803 RepID=W3TW80_BARQI|nr:inner membrane ABC transporter permease yejB [Bartonella quintana BQ2-D70]ETS13889.1 inner membrane ABC transporter permease yejB [Bartonella quintana JK 73rel]ETS15576.1 inner membrane ABC transporter permease yejB [Bartonella quintana JK 73]ETS17582.1 inner membrane ABC transporter permease yejB [Bartonella quintana JK 7]ETS18412.1 inner membrane ABC transporter permease yejB [Bartonella quintana JK 12]KEC59406.1 inner membrane ABC transporter permease yejB [Bartonella quintana JK 19]KEC